jgi:hypothetical protein
MEPGLFDVSRFKTGLEGPQKMVGASGMNVHWGSPDRRLSGTLWIGRADGSQVVYTRAWQWHSDDSRSH